jgi:hypothetical protein
MDSHTFLNSSIQKLKVADHLLSTTYSIVKDPKLLVSVIENIFNAMEFAVEAMLVHEKNFKTIEYSSSFESKMEMFRRKILSKYTIDAEIITFINELKTLLDEHKSSKVEFTKKEKFVITDDDFNLKMLTFDEVRKEHTKAKHYIDDISKIISKYD